MRRRLVPLLLVAVGLVLGACQPVTYSAGPGPRIFRTGDSVLWQSDDEVRSVLQSAGFRTASAVYPGTSIGWSADRIMEQVWGDGGRQAPDVVLVASGNMNVAGGWTAEDEAEATRVLEWANPEQRCTVWVLPSAVRHPATAGEVAYLDPDAVETAAGIRRVAATRGVHVLDWGTVAAGRPEWYARDGVHHNDEGQAAYADVVVGELRRLCRV